MEPRAQFCFREQASAQSPCGALLRWTSCSSARRHSAGYCFVPDCERVHVNGGAAPTVLQRRRRGHQVNPLLSPREGIRAESARRPGKRGKEGSARGQRDARGKRPPSASAFKAGSIACRSSQCSRSSPHRACIGATSKRLGRPRSSTTASFRATASVYGVALEGLTQRTASPDTFDFGQVAGLIVGVVVGWPWVALVSDRALLVDRGRDAADAYGVSRSSDASVSAQGRS